MSKKHLQSAIENPDQQIRASSNNILGKVYWSLVSQLGITPASFNVSLNRFVRNPCNVSEQTAHKRSEKMSNLTAELTNPARMSWNKFLQGLQAIEVVKIRFKVEVWRGKRRIYAETIIETELDTIRPEEERNEGD